jgi:RNA-binding protein YhbY
MEPVPPPKMTEANLDVLAEEEIAETMRAALDELAAADDTDDPVSVAGLRHSVLTELNRRLGDTELVKGLPGTALLQLAKELLKDKTEESEALPPHPSVLEIVQSVNLPSERKRELLLQERQWLGEEATRVDAVLVELESVLERERGGSA